jgi:hypothetical protein
MHVKLSQDPNRKQRAEQADDRARCADAHKDRAVGFHTRETAAMSAATELAGQTSGDPRSDLSVDRQHHHDHDGAHRSVAWMRTTMKMVAKFLTQTWQHSEVVPLGWTVWRPR